MSSKDKILDDIAQLAGGTMGALHGAKEQIKTTMRSGIDSFAHDLDLVPREDFEKLELMLEKSRKEQEDIKKRLDEIEATLRKK